MAKKLFLAGQQVLISLSLSGLVNSEDVKMPVRALAPCLLCFLSMLTILTPASTHPQHRRCQLVSFFLFF